MTDTETVTETETEAIAQRFGQFQQI